MLTPNELASTLPFTLQAIQRCLHSVVENNDLGLNLAVEVTWPVQVTLQVPAAELQVHELGWRAAGRNSTDDLSVLRMLAGSM
jgi:hypothetical protein